MPYINKKDRHFKIQIKDTIKSAGQLNYLLTVICNGYLTIKGESYQTYNDIIGVLECMKQEWYRRKVAPYEEKKMEENGDVF